MVSRFFQWPQFKMVQSIVLMWKKAKLHALTARMDTLVGLGVEKVCQALPRDGCHGSSRSEVVRLLHGARNSNLFGFGSKTGSSQPQNAIDI